MALVITFVFGCGGAAAALGSEMYFMLVRMPLQRKPGEELSSCEATGMRAVARAAIGCGKLCSALDQEYRELAERIQID